MKNLVFFGALALLFIVVLGNVETEADNALAAGDELLLREARDAYYGRRGREGRKKRKNSGRRRRGKGKGKGKGKGQRKRNNKSRRNNSKRKGGKGGKGVVKNGPSNRADCDGAKVKDAFNKYVKASNLLRQGKRADSRYTKTNNKADKCATQFTSATTLLNKTTNNGASCGGSAPSANVTETYTILKDCPSTCAALCNTSNVVYNQTAVNDCTDKTTGSLPALIKEIETCLRSLDTDCTCLDTIGSISSECDPYLSTLLDEVNVVRDQCLSKTETGSFSYCSSKAKEAPSIAEECGSLAPGSMTTASARIRNFKDFIVKMH